MDKSANKPENGGQTPLPTPLEGVAKVDPTEAILAKLIALEGKVSELKKPKRTNPTAAKNLEKARAVRKMKTEQRYREAMAQALGVPVESLPGYKPPEQPVVVAPLPTPTPEKKVEPDPPAEEEEEEIETREVEVPRVKPIATVAPRKSMRLSSKEADLVDDEAVLEQQLYTLRQSKKVAALREQAEINPLRPHASRSGLLRKKILDVGY